MAYKSSGPRFTWEDEEDDDDDFISKYPHYSTRALNNSNVYGGSATTKVDNDYEYQRQKLLDEKRQIQQRTLANTNTSIGLLYESEQVGIQTAEELVKQREQLENVDVKLDEINSTMRISQKHINAMKSFFGGLKGYFKKTPDPSLPSSSRVSDVNMPSSSGLRTRVDEITHQSTSATTHPALRDKAFDGSASITSSDQLYEAKFNQNLEEMCSGLGRLKHLAIGLQDEIEEQNELLDRINDKASRAEETVGHQNIQIKRLLKK